MTIFKFGLALTTKSMVIMVMTLSSLILLITNSLAAMAMTISLSTDLIQTMKLMAEMEMT